MDMVISVISVICWIEVQEGQKVQEEMRDGRWWFYEYVILMLTWQLGFIPTRILGFWN